MLLIQATVNKPFLLANMNYQRVQFYLVFIIKLTITISTFSNMARLLILCAQFCKYFSAFLWVFLTELNYIHLS